MNNYQAAAAAAAQGFGPPASPHASGRGAFPAANSPGPIDMYSSSAAESVAGYVQAASPQPSGFPAIAVSRAPINYSPVSRTHAAYLMPWASGSTGSGCCSLLVPSSILQALLSRSNSSIKTSETSFRDDSKFYQKKKASFILLILTSPSKTSQ